MQGTLAHRGPDGEGTFVEGGVGLGHRRLAILDLSPAGAQPRASADERFVITYNGEIFNFVELRDELIALGHRFSSRTDTEVLLAMFAQYGEAMLPRLNGMFAFAIYDRQDKSVFLARDRMGIKPLYVSLVDGTRLVFASEQKAIFRAGVSKAIDESAMTELLMLRHVSGPRTVFKQVQRLLPGHWLKVANGKLTHARWWNFEERIATARHHLPNDPAAWFVETFRSSLRYRMISDVPVGLLLSGGLDSSSMAAALHEQGHTDMEAFTSVFDEREYNEGPLAKEVADAFGLHFNGVKVTGRALGEHLERASWVHDEPLVHQNDAQLLALSLAAKPRVSVLLSGDGADELLGGYLRYRPLQFRRLLQLARPFAALASRYRGGSALFRHRLSKMHRYLGSGSVEGLVLFNASNLYPPDFATLGIEPDSESLAYRQTVLEEATRAYPLEPARQAMYFDTLTHLPSVLDRNDRMTMGASVECRVPFLDFRLVETLAALPSQYLLRGRRGKFLLANTFGKKLPPRVRAFKKFGFGVPWESYFRRDDYFREIIRDIPKDAFLGSGVLGKLDRIALIQRFERGDPVATTVLRQLVMLRIWHTAYYERI